MNRIHTFVQLGCLAITAIACGGSTADPSPSGPSDASAGLLYVGACTPAACDGLGIPEIGCASGEPTVICAASPEGQCRIGVECPEADPDGTTSWSPCDDTQCGPVETQPDSACPEGYAWGAPQCGKLDDAQRCAWANHCVKQPTDATRVDPSKVGKACGIDDQQNTIQCDGTDTCAVLPPETGVEGAHCFADPCAVLGCPSTECMILESYPAQVRCGN